MAQAKWNGTVIAETDKFEIVEGNVYFPPESLNREFFKSSKLQTTCSWKGEASYYTVEVDGKSNADAAWFYPEPLDAAKKIKDHVAFWNGVEVTE